MEDSLDHGFRTAFQLDFHGQDSMRGSKPSSGQLDGF